MDIKEIKRELEGKIKDEDILICFTTIDGLTNLLVKGTFTGMIDTIAGILMEDKRIALMFLSAIEVYNESLKQSLLNLNQN